MALGRASGFSMNRTTAPNCLGWIAAALVLSLAVTATAQKAPPGASKAPAPVKAEEEEPLPKPGPRGPGEKPKLSLPPFMGFFGPAELLKKTGFRGTVGSFIEFDILQDEAGGARAGSLLIQQVGPSVRGGRWMEMVATQTGGQGGGIRMLTKGTDDDNMERLIVQGPGLPPMEMPIDSAQLEWIAPGAPGAKDPSRVAELGELRHVGRVEVEIPLGRFMTEHWILSAGERSMEFWTTADPLVPFSGMVMVKRSDGNLVATRVGTDAKAKFMVPQRMQ